MTEQEELVLVKKWWRDVERLSQYGILALAIAGISVAIPTVFGVGNQADWLLTACRLIGSWTGLGVLLYASVVNIAELFGVPIYRRVVIWRKQK